MKKFRGIFVAIAIVLIGVIASVYITKTKAIDKNTESVISNYEVTSTDESTESTTPKKDLTFAVLGDVHGNIPSFQDAIEDLHNINPSMDLLVLNGDTVDQGKEESYVSIKDAISKNKNFLPKTIIKNIGNHEFYDYEAGSNSLSKLKSL